MRYEGVVDIFQTVKMLRTQRPAMVQTEVRKISRRRSHLKSQIMDFICQDLLESRDFQHQRQNTGKYCGKNIQLFNIFEPYPPPFVNGSGSVNILELVWKLSKIMYQVETCQIFSVWSFRA